SKPLRPTETGEQVARRPERGPRSLPQPQPFGGEHNKNTFGRSSLAGECKLEGAGHGRPNPFLVGIVCLWGRSLTASSGGCPKSHNARFFSELPWLSHFIRASMAHARQRANQAGGKTGRRGAEGRPRTMNSIDRYIFRTTFGAFALIVVSLTMLIWVTQALREIDLMTNQGQAVLVFIGMTGLLIPVLVLIIAPIALMIAVTHSLHRLSADSEMVVMSAAGMSPWRLSVPFILVALLVSLMVGFIGAYLGPKGLRELRNWAAQLRADLVSTIIKPGRFTTIERGLTFYIRDRRPN